MADNIDRELDNLDNLGLDDMDMDLGMDDNQPVNAKNISNILKKEFVSTDRLKKVGSRLVENIPKDLSKKADIISAPLREAEEVVNKQLDPLRDDAVNFLDNLEKTAGGFTIVKNLITKIKNIIKRDKSSETAETTEQKVQRLLQTELSNISNNAVADKINTLVNTYQGYTQKKLLTNILATIKATSEVQTQLYKEYNNTHLKIELKQLVALESMNQLLVTNIPVMMKYMEAITKNTGLPDIAKMKTFTYLKRKFEDKLFDTGMEFLSKNSFVKSITEAVKDKANQIVGGISNVLGMGNILLESMNMSKEMNVSTLESVISGIADIATNKAVDTLGKNAIELALRTTLGRKGVTTIDKYTSDLHHGASDLVEQLRGKNTVYGDMLANVMEFIAMATSGKRVADINLLQHNPNDPAIFDYKTKTAIVNVIPTFLSKIYSELVGIRTGIKPSSELVYDYNKNKFTTTTSLRHEVKKTLIKQSKELSETLDDKRLFGLIESRAKLSTSERKKIKEALTKHIMAGGTTSPYYLEREGFYDLLPSSLAKKVKSAIDASLQSTSQKDILLRRKFMESMEDAKMYANQAGSAVAKTAYRVSSLGRTDILEELGLVKGDDHSKIEGENVANVFHILSQKYTTGRLHLDTEGLSYKDYIAAMKAKKDIIEKIKKLQDYRISEQDKERVIALLDEIPASEYVRYNNKLRTDTNVYLFIKDMLERKEKYKQKSKTLKDLAKEKLDKLTPEQVKKWREVQEQKIKNMVFGIKTKLGVEDNVKEDILYKDIYKDVDLEDNTINKITNPGYLGLRHRIPKGYQEYANNNYTGMRAASLAIPNTEFKFIKDIIEVITKNTTSIVNAIKAGIDKLIEFCCTDEKTVKFSESAEETIINSVSKAIQVDKHEPIKPEPKESTPTNLNEPKQEEKSNITDSIQHVRNKANELKARMENKIIEENQPLNPNMRKAFISFFGKGNNDNDNNENIFDKIPKGIKNIYNRFIKKETNDDNGYVPNFILVDDEEVNESQPSIFSKLKNKFKNSWDNIKKEYDSVKKDIELEQMFQRAINGGETDAESFIRRLKTKGKNIWSNIFDINASTIQSQYEELKTKYSGKISNVKKELNKEYENIKREGLFKVISNYLSKFPLPEPDKADEFYTSKISKIDPLGIFRKIFKSTTDFISTMYVIHFKSLEGQSINSKELEDLGIDVNDSVLPHGLRQMLWGAADQSHYDPTNFIERMIPVPLRDMVKSYGITDLLSKIAGIGIRSAISIPKALLSNIPIIGQTARETFLDDKGRVRINLLRIGKFLGKSYYRTAINTGKELRGVYSDVFEGIKDTAGYATELLAKYGLGLGRLNKTTAGKVFSKIPGLNKIDEKILVRRAPLPYEVKAAYLRGLIKFKDIPKMLGGSQLEIYLNWLMEEEQALPHGSPLKKFIHNSVKTYFKSLKTTGKVSEPIYSTVGKATISSIKNLGKFTAKMMGSEDFKDMIFKSTSKAAKTVKNVGESTSPIYNNIFKSMFNIPNILAKILGVDELLEKKTTIESKEERTTNKMLNKIKSIFSKKKYTRENDREDMDKKVNDDKTEEHMKKTKTSKSKENKTSNDLLNKITSIFKTRKKPRKGSYEEKLKEFKLEDEKENKEEEKIIKNIHKHVKSSSNSTWWPLIIGGVSILVEKLKHLFLGKSFIGVLGTVFKKIIWEPIRWLGGKIIDGVGHLFSKLLDHIPGFNTVKNVFNKVKTGIKDTIETTKNIIKHPIDYIDKAFSWLKSKAISGLDLIKRSASFIKDRVVKGITYLTKDAKIFISKLSPEALKNLVSKLSPNAIKVAIKKIVEKLIPKLGVDGAKKIGSELISKLIPGLGTVLLGIDAATVAYYHFIKKWSLLRSIAYGLLGIDIGDDENTTQNHLHSLSLDTNYSKNINEINENRTINNTYTSNKFIDNNTTNMDKILNYSNIKYFNTNKTNHIKTEEKLQINKDKSSNITYAHPIIPITSTDINNTNIHKKLNTISVFIPNDEEIKTNLAKYKNKKPKIDVTLANLHTTRTLVQHQIHNNILTNETNEILKESLQIQMTMAQYLKGIYDLTKLVYINGIPTRVDNTNKDKQEIEKELNQIEDNKIKHIIDRPSKPVFSVNIEHF